MNRQQAKEILSAFRPGTEDEHDPIFADALQWAEHDPELAAWLKDQQAFDAAVSRRLGAWPAPLGLLEEIRAGAKNGHKAAWRRRIFLSALAACLALSAILGALWWSRPAPSETNQFRACRRDLVAFLRTFPRLDLETANLAEARRWLADTHHLSQIDFPTRLRRFPTIGCRTLAWHGHRLALVCFMVDGEVVHLILIPRSGIGDGPPTTEPQFARIAGVTTAAWSRGDLTYLLLSNAREDFLRERL
jgi:hypothetical protein